MNALLLKIQPAMFREVPYLDRIVLIFVYDLPNVSKLLDPIMFADDTNYFFSHHDFKTLFDTVNNELSKIR